MKLASASRNLWVAVPCGASSHFCGWPSGSRSRIGSSCVTTRGGWGAQVLGGACKKVRGVAGGGVAAPRGWVGCRGRGGGRGGVVPPPGPRPPPPPGAGPPPPPPFSPPPPPAPPGGPPSADRR